MSKAKFEAARELIQEKKYDEARAILGTIDHPKAAEWIGKIDSLVLAPVELSETHHSRAPKILVGFVILLFAGIAALMGYAVLVAFRVIPPTVYQADGPLPVVPDSLNPTLAYKSLIHCTDIGLTEHFRTFIEQDMTDLNKLGTDASIFLGQHCDMETAFQITWDLYHTNNRSTRTNDEPKAKVWSAFIYGFQRAQKNWTDYSAQSTATMSAYETANPN